MARVRLGDVRGSSVFSTGWLRGRVEKSESRVGSGDLVGFEDRKRGRGAVDIPGS